MIKIHSLTTISKCFHPRPSHLVEHLDICDSWLPSSILAPLQFFLRVAT